MLHASDRLPSAAERSLLLAASGLGQLDPRVAPDVDWPFLIAYAQRNVVHAALARMVIASSMRPALSPSVLEELREVAIGNELQNRALLADLASVVRLLEGNGVPSIVLKGAGLMARHPGLARTRHTDDIDLWVRPDRAEDAGRLLRANGWRRVGQEHWPLTYDGRVYAAKSEHHGHQLPPLVGPNGTPLDLHRRPPTDDRAQAWDDAQAEIAYATIDGVRVAIRDDAAMLADLCAHVVLHHRAEPVLWPRHVMDVMALTERRPELFALATKRSRAAERAALAATRVVLEGARDAGAEGAIARRLLFPTSRFGWGWWRLGELAYVQLRGGPRAVARAVWPSETFLRKRGFEPERGLLRAHARRFRDILARTGAA